MDKNAYNALYEKMEHGCVYERAENGAGFFRARALKAQSSIDHGFSSREGGVSAGAYESLNLSTTKDDAPENVKANFKIFAQAAGLDYGAMCIVNHEHGAKVFMVDRRFCGRGFDEPELDFCDGLVTNDASVTLVTSHADCNAVFLYDPVKRAIGLAHAGWKGTLLGIGRVLAKRLAAEYGSDPADMIASDGPCICKSCFETDISLAEEFARAFDYEDIYTHGRPGKAYVDIEAALAIQLMDAGVRPENITLMHECTFEDRALLFSHRRDKGDTGSMAAYMRLFQ